MNFKDLAAPVGLECWGTLAGNDMMLVPGAVEMRSGKRRGAITLAQGENLVTFSCEDSAHGNRLEQYLHSGAASLASVLMVKERSLQLSARFYHGGPLHFASIDIGFDDKAINACTRQGLRGTPEEILGRLESRMVYGPAGADPVFVVQPTEDEEGQADDGLGRGFTMLGNGYRLEVALQRNADNEPVFVARRLLATRTTKAGGIRLATGKLRFLDHTRLGQLRPLAQAAMSRLTQGVGSYFRAWDGYGSLEGAMLLQRARTVGALKPVTVEAGTRGTRFFIEGGIAENVAASIDVLDIVGAAPSYLVDPNMDWDTYCEEVSERRGEDPAHLATARVLHCDAHSVTLDVRFAPKLKEHLLVLSMRGDLEQIKRRMKARQMILEGRSANPLLGLIIEKDGDMPRAERPPRIEPLSPNVLRKVFRKPPTERQKLAIDLALNTPDIMVIQGPPGTGKTTVITAIIERLNEQRDKRRPGKGEVLVTAHQHDAVNNVISRLQVDGRPAIKFGARSGDGDGAPARMDDWSGDLASRIRAAHPDIRTSELQRQLSQQASAYLAAPSLAQGAALLCYIAQLPSRVLDTGLAERNRDLLQDLTEQMNADGQQAGQAVRALHGLRTTAAGFIDDGPDGAGMVLLHCRAALGDADADLLEQATMWSGTGAPPFLDALATLKERLLGRYCKPPPFRFDKPRDDLLSHLASVSRAVERHELETGDPVAAILADFVHELEGNPGGVSDALGEYSFVFAATCQGAERNEIRRAKRTIATRADTPIEYDTVIVDEAARVSPRDLLIPMAQGLRRIILVGDHRQLPHIVEKEIIRQFEAGDGDTSMLKGSAFEYLRARAIELERRDGIARTVTLDRQYRMHPLLGNFVSAQFYDHNGEGFGSPDDDKPYRHTLPGTEGRPLAWLDVPHGAGPERKRPPSSWFRTVEAEKIVEQLHAWIGTEEGSKLSFGIITFYRAQVDEIHEALARRGYAVRMPSGEWTIAPGYREKIGDMERLRVGTVDAFQGMEFDVVFLSIVRSPRPQRGAPARNAAGVFGRLQTESLQCVGMSRQKRLLVVAGDAALLDHPLAPQAVPALHKLHRLCATRGVLL